MKAHAIETENLEAHVSICQERYTALANRFDSLENRIDKMEILMQSIHRDIEEMKNANTNQWDRAKDLVIGVLFASTAFLLTQQLF